MVWTRKWFYRKKPHRVIWSWISDWARLWCVVIPQASSFFSKSFILALSKPCPCFCPFRFMSLWNKSNYPQESMQFFSCPVVPSLLCFLPPPCNLSVPSLTQMHKRNCKTINSAEHLRSCFPLVWLKLLEKFSTCSDVLKSTVITKSFDHGGGGVVGWWQRLLLQGPHCQCSLPELPFQCLFLETLKV